MPFTKRRVGKDYDAAGPILLFSSFLEVKIMITNIKPAQFAGLRPTQTPPPAQESQEPPGSVDEVDLRVIDSAAKAAQLPIMDPAVQLAIGLGISVAAQGGVAVGLTVAGSALSVFGESTPMISHYDITEQGGQSFGMVGAEVSRENFIVSEDGGVVWSGGYGANSSRLEFNPIEGTQKVRVHGHLGSVDADLEMEFLLNDDGITGTHMAGKLGGDRYLVESIMVQDKMMVRGHLAGSSIEQDYKMNLDTSEDHAALSVVGDGDSPAAFHKELQVLLNMHVTE